MEEQFEATLHEGGSPTEISEVAHTMNTTGNSEWNIFNLIDNEVGGLGNVTPFDVYSERHLRKEAKNETLTARRSYSGAVGRQGLEL